jgi:hypothetical protein
MNPVPACACAPYLRAARVLKNMPCRNATRYDQDSVKTQAETIADLSARCAGPNEFENFDRAFRQSLTVPKSALLKEDARWKRVRAKKRAKKIG